MIDEEKTKLHVEKLWELFSIVLEALSKKITSGEAKSFDFSNAINFLKMNGIATKYLTHGEVGNQLVLLHNETIDLPFKVIEGKDKGDLKTHEFM